MLTIKPALPEERATYPPSRSAANASFAGQLKTLAIYLAQSEVHTYAFSVAANTILSLFPFIVMTWTIERRVFHSQSMESVLGDMLRYFLPAHQDFVVKNMALLAHARGKVQVISIVTLLISSTGVFMPLEVALNRVWGVTKNRSYLVNQLISLGLAVSVGVLALFSVAFTAAQNRVLSILFLNRTQGIVFHLLGGAILRMSAALFSIGIFFLIYWVLPNRKLPVAAVLPTAIVTGLLWEMAKTIYVFVLPWMDLESAYGPFSVSVSLMIWAFLTGLILLAGAHLSATRYTLRLAHQADLEEQQAKP
ncbi:YihY family inner membrane protein [Silvibacterium bohemicum]|uniref:YihY family inner membrane protein n=1 Tax=Silvibacterium bohemicum TaxID=1577686 RepID=A0A841JZB9_9BACT|nr:YihY/virulence factor BrkB family protein [Silvibacterium bohemicum]MBB6146666.1 YihY family inner membrane protein [Silvibacterium bohemicum]